MKVEWTIFDTHEWHIMGRGMQPVTESKGWWDFISIVKPIHHCILVILPRVPR